MCVFLDGLTSEKPAARDVELWRMPNGERGMYLPRGIDLRPFENGEMTRTELFQDVPSLQGPARRLNANSAWR